MARTTFTRVPIRQRHFLFKIFINPPDWYQRLRTCATDNSHKIECTHVIPTMAYFLPFTFGYCENWNNLISLISTFKKWMTCNMSVAASFLPELSCVLLFSLPFHRCKWMFIYMAAYIVLNSYNEVLNGAIIGIEEDRRWDTLNVVPGRLQAATETFRQLSSGQLSNSFCWCNWSNKSWTLHEVRTRDESGAWKQNFGYRFFLKFRIFCQ